MSFAGEAGGRAGLARSAPLELSFATFDHDRTMPLHRGEVTIEGVRLSSEVHPTGKLFPLAVGAAPYDITEMSISSYAMQVSRGVGEYIGIPAFVSRAFRHSGFFVRRGSGVQSPADFVGRRIGVPEYQMTAALWMRGILSDEYGVNARDVRWRTGALDVGIRHERLALNLPTGMEVRPIADGETLQDLLRAGAIDGLLAPKPPSAFLEGDPNLVRVFDDFESVELDYYKRTGFFPIMHLIGVRKSLVTAHPWLPKALYGALVEAKRIAMDRLRAIWLGNSNRLSLPFLGASMERTVGTLGKDYWPYGFAANRNELAAVCRYSVQQHLAERLVEPEELFDPSVLDT